TTRCVLRKTTSADYARLSRRTQVYHSYVTGTSKNRRRKAIAPRSTSPPIMSRLFRALDRYSATTSCRPGGTTTARKAGDTENVGDSRPSIVTCQLGL